MSVKVIHGKQKPASREPVLPPTHNINIVTTEPLTVPRALKSACPVTSASHETVVSGRNAIRRILARTDRRLLTVVGPCSIHDVEAAMDYAHRLAEVKRRLDDRLCIVMRVYFEKPRTTVGWKGLINDPHMDGSFDMAEGLRLARQLLLDVTAMGLPTATEMLDPITPQYIDDLVCWASIGARTTESQTHRQMASGLSMPVGFKNNTDGNLQVAIDAMKSARSPHHFLGMDEDGRTCLITTAGNNSGHLVLRGGNGQPNYHPETVQAATARLTEAGLDPVLMVDCSHANSFKQPSRQGVVLDSIIGQIIAGDEAIVGAMLESNLHEGRQDIPEHHSKLKYGVSVTDECLGWDKTEQLLVGCHERLGAILEH